MLNHSLLKFDGNGRIRNTGAVPSRFAGGVGFNGGLLCLIQTPVTHVHQSNPFGAAGRIAALTGAPTHFSQGGLPHTANGRLAVSSGAIDHYSHGLPYAADGSLVIAPAEAPGTFATLDPANKAAIMILSENNLRCVSNSAAGRGVAFGTLGKASGKWYWEALSLSAATAQGVGIGTAGTNMNEYLGQNASSWGYFPSGAYWTNAVNVGTGASWGVNSILGFALDVAGNLDVYVNGVLGLTINHGLAGSVFPGLSDSSAGGVCDFMMNFGSDSSFNGRQTAQNNPDSDGNGDFYYAPPAGYLSMLV